MANENYLNSKVVKTYKIYQANLLKPNDKDDRELFFITLYKEQAYALVEELVKVQPKLAELLTIEEEDMALEFFLAILSELLCGMINKLGKPRLFANFLN